MAGPDLDWHKNLTSETDGFFFSFSAFPREMTLPLEVRIIVVLFCSLDFWSVFFGASDGQSYCTHVTDNNVIGDNMLP